MEKKNEMPRCDYCGRKITPEEQALEWPIDTEDGEMCPSCYGDEAFCRCGAVLPATDDVAECNECRALAEEIRGAEDLWIALSEAGCERPIGEEGDTITQAVERERYHITRVYRSYLMLAERGDERILVSCPGRPCAVSLDLSGKMLEGANLSRLDLRSLNLSRANLTRAKLAGSNLSRANLTGATLCGADLSGADLAAANLNGADLRGADLSHADIRRATLQGARLDGTRMDGAITD